MDQRLTRAAAPATKDGRHNHATTATAGQKTHLGGSGGGGDGENRRRWRGDDAGRGCTSRGRPVRRRHAAPLPRPCTNSGEFAASLLATEQRENGRVRAVVNGEARAGQRRKKGGTAMVRPWSTFARSPTIGAGAPEHDSGHCEAWAGFEMLWGACGERGVSGAGKEGFGWPFIGGRLSHRGQREWEVQGASGHAIGASRRCGNVGEHR